ncbi:hypothetical protein D3248_06940 [Leucobacter zeae]|nr:hypothetical protein [Leucobacter zeae]
MPEGPARLRVERALRAAARAGNRLLSGGVARVEVTAEDDRRVLVGALARSGVRCAADAAAPADFVFVDRAHGGDAATAGPEAGTVATESGVAPHGAGGGLPAVVVGLDGSLRSSRSDDAPARIAWAARGMPATSALAERLRAANAGRSPRIAVSLVLEPKTAAFTLALAEAGCEVALFSATSETDTEVAAALAADGRVAVFAPTAPVDPHSAPSEPNAPGAGTRAAEFEAAEADSAAVDVAAVDAAHAAGVLAWGPEFLIDDGSHLIRLAHTERREALRGLRAAAEETTSGVRPLHEMARDGMLRIPVVSVNDARTKTGFDNLIGTGQSCVFAIADLLDAAGWSPRRGGSRGDRAGSTGGVDAAASAGYPGVAGTRWTIVGYGPVGVGTARFAAALGARVAVVERDPVLALAALHDGFEARTAADALPDSDVVVSATGVWHTLDAMDLAAVPDGAAVAVAGGIDDELALDALRAQGWTERRIADGVDEWIAPGRDAGPLVLARGGGVNYTAAEGNPIEVMDLSFATQLAALVGLLERAPAPGVHPLGSTAERAVADAALGARGGRAAEGAAPARAGGAAQPWTVHRYRAHADGTETP